jgi:hypothetical protein
MAFTSPNPPETILLVVASAVKVAPKEMIQKALEYN